MGKLYRELSDEHRQFIAVQRLYFVATATDTSSINLSPKGMDSLRVLDARRVAWLNLTGSGNETAAHVQQFPRMTIMFCAFEGSPMILRLYGQARAVHQGAPDWAELQQQFSPIPGARQIFDMYIEQVQTSCGAGVPLYDYRGERAILPEWAVKKGEDGLRHYWEEKNQWSIDGIASHILEKNSR